MDFSLRTGSPHVLQLAQTSALFSVGGARTCKMHFSLRTGPPHVLQLAQPSALLSMGDTRSEGL